MFALETFKEAYQAELERVLPERIAAVDWGASELEASQTQLLRALLDHAKTRSVWHREWLKSIEPGTFSLDDLHRLPIMSKSDLNGNFDDISTDPKVTRGWCEAFLEGGNSYTDGTYALIASGGTSGQRTIQVYSPLAMAQFVGMGIRMRARHTAKTGAAPTGGKNVWIAAASGGAHATAVMAPLGGNLPDEQRFAVTDPIEKIIDGLNKLQPAVLMIYSSFLRQLIQAQSDGRLNISPAEIALTSETPAASDMDRAKEIWNCAISSTWASSEFGTMGRSGYFQDGHLLSDDLLLIEAVDEENNPVGPGVQAPKLLMTNLYNTVLPLIRYEMTDQMTIYPEPAVCGSNFRAASYVSGRLDDHFVYDGAVRVHCHLFTHVLEQRAGILEYQVRQTKEGVAVSLVQAEQIDIEGIAATLERDLVRIGVSSPVADVTVVSSIERTAAQKLRRFIAL